MKICSQCSMNLPLENFDIQSTGKLGRRADCKECRKRFTRTPFGLCKEIYAAQKVKSKRRKYSPPTYTEEELFVWINSQTNFIRLFNEWVNSGYQTNLRPSVDRIDDYKSYQLSNIRLITWKENNENNYASQIQGLNTKKSIAVDMLDESGMFIKRFHSVSDAAREFNGIPSNIIGAINNRVSRKKLKDGSYRTWTISMAYGYKWRYSTQPNINTENL